MLLSTLIIALVSPAWAAPTPSRERNDIARLARIANDAYHPDRSSSGRRIHYSEPEIDEPGWLLTHHPDTQTLTIAFTSPSPESVLEILASSNLDDSDYLVPLPTSFLVPLPTSFLESDTDLAPLIYAPYAQYLEILQEAIESMNNFIVHPPTARSWLADPMYLILDYFGFHHTPAPAPEVNDIEIVGHGLGSVLALLSSLAIHQAHPALNCKTALFSMPRIGDDHFAQYVNDILDKSDQVEIQRLTYGRDPLPSLPPPHYGLVHPSSIREVLLETEDNGREGKKGKLEDGFGPYWGQTVGRI